jgi:bifunctional NMN adenylyltransferase/nudix hydrolase
MKDYAHAVYIGRFQPFHNGHLAVIQRGLEIAEKVHVLIGSASAAPSVRNPWSYEERRTMIESSVAAPLGDMTISPVRDYYYNENAWLADVQARTDAHISDGDSVALLGAYRDRSSYYLRSFPQWEFQPTDSPKISGTEIRNLMFSVTALSDFQGKPSENMEYVPLSEYVPAKTNLFIQNWMRTEATFVELCREFRALKEYHQLWANSPFPPTFVTVDAVVVCSGHVLVVKRGVNPGKGRLAIPGGFLRQQERIIPGALRELREETGIKVDKLILESQIVDQRVFDHPDRSLRGRTITHGIYIKLRDGKLPDVRGNDDAAAAMWIPLWDVVAREREFHEDHAHIIHAFVNSNS